MNLISRLRRGVLTWIDSNDLPWILPWSGSSNPREREVRSLRRFATRLIRQELVARQGWARTLTQAAVWPVLATLKTHRHLRNKWQLYGPNAWAAAFARIWWVQLFHNLRLADQIEYRLDLPDRRSLVRSFLSCQEQQILLRHAALRVHGYPDLDDKSQLARFCEEHSLPHPAIVMQGTANEVTAEAPWPATDLIFKPTNLCQGQSIEILRFDAARDRWVAHDGTELSPATLPAFALGRLQGGPWLVQPRLVNPVGWRHLTPGPLSTLRIVTGRVPPDGRLVIVGVQARFALASPFVDNVSAGGMSAFVDSTTGRMNIGMAWNGEPSEHTNHPVTGGRIEGEILPDWPALRDLALRAHTAAGAWSSIGWDIAATTLGPMIIEANLLWGAISFVPQGRMPFLEVMRTAFGPDYPKRDLDRAADSIPYDPSAS